MRHRKRPRASVSGRGVGEAEVVDQRAARRDPEVLDLHRRTDRWGPPSRPEDTHSQHRPRCRMISIPQCGPRALPQHFGGCSHTYQVGPPDASLTSLETRVVPRLDAHLLRAKRNRRRLGCPETPQLPVKHQARASTADDLLAPRRQGPARFTAVLPVVITSSTSKMLRPIKLAGEGQTKAPRIFSIRAEADGCACCRAEFDRRST